MLAKARQPKLLHVEYMERKAYSRKHDLRKKSQRVHKFFNDINVQPIM